MTLAAGLLISADDPRRLLRSGKPEAAVAAYREQELRRPKDVETKRNLGIALLQSGQAGDAMVKLQEARALDRNDHVTLFFLGDAAHRAGNSDLALDAYTDYLAKGGRDPQIVRARVHAISMERIAAAVKQSLLKEPPPLETIPTNTIAVPEFHAVAPNDTLRPLCRGLALVLTTDLSQVPELRVVERQRLHVLTSEKQLAPTVDPSTAPAVGGYLHVRRFAQGGIVPLHGPNLQLQASVIDALTREARSPRQPIAGPLQEVMEMEKRLAFQILEVMEIPITPELRRRIGRPVTRNFDAFLAFCRGVEHEEGGRAAEALRQYREAVRLDPKFRMARTRQEIVAVDAAGESALRAALEKAATQSAVDVTSGSIGAMGLGPLPTGPTERGDSRLSSTSRTTGGPTVVVRGRIR